HAAQPFDEAFAFFLIQMDKHLGIAVGSETMPLGLEIGTERLEVVDLAVEDDLDGAVLVADRLIASGQVDDRQATVDETDSRLGKEALRVGPAMRDALAHSSQNRIFDRSRRVRE